MLMRAKERAGRSLATGPKSAQSAGQTYFPVVDLFAGPGGLGEGFAAAGGGRDHPRFRSVISIERDLYSHQTLQLRHFVHAFGVRGIPEEYYEFLAGNQTLQELYESYPSEAESARRSALRISLGPESRGNVRDLIDGRLRGCDQWALVGGPPCQAYSLVGRSRMKGSPGFETDERHTLYLEFLRIVADHAPPIFVMENVKGLLSARVRGRSVIQRIVSDLEMPASAIRGASPDLHYKLYSLSQSSQAETVADPRGFLVRAEDYGIPQARHRMFIVGVRGDIKIKPSVLRPMTPPTVRQTIGSLPSIRSELSMSTDASVEAWAGELRRIAEVNIRRKLNGTDPHGAISLDLSGAQLAQMRLPRATASVSYPQKIPSHDVLRRLHDPRLTVLTAHESRSHMASDLRRYLFAAVFAQHTERSPSLADFPDELLPDHRNAKEGRNGKMFSDRFRVQLADHVSTTITSHISKDGHYFIHYDPRQCRSLTVREAARLQTFPDNYFFCGPRTSQYHQVGNAVPPQLARQIADIVADVLARMKSARK